ncbi:unnamed protein product [Chrysodeixis includens]|uniref:DNA topoisomerase 1 n=1 Tax=Chrysodeixis includens TaxID=689277 RepID=A0A9P0FWC4_CHRIL|nr:unnamed protein product [Chrysodeixis includens]
MSEDSMDNIESYDANDDENDNLARRNNKEPKWEILKQNGPLLPPEYTPLPPNVNFFYGRKAMRLSLATEEVACFYAKTVGKKYSKRKTFINNFFTDWCKQMTYRERALIKDFAKCDFTQINRHFIELSKSKKKQSNEEKKRLKSKLRIIKNKYSYCYVDGNKEKIRNYKMEPPGLFIGRGNHPKMGKLKTRVMPEDITINCSQGSDVPEPPAGHQWGDIIHDNSVSWLASWVGNVLGKKKYVVLHSSSKPKQAADKEKYDTAKELHKYIDRIRDSYTSDNMLSYRSIVECQLAVALYFIDTLALRVGNEKEKDLADTVGCCSLRVGHVKLNDGTQTVQLNFRGKGSIYYHKEIKVESHIFYQLRSFKEGKKSTARLFDAINTRSLNDHLKQFMTKLSAKVFRTYNVSRKMQTKLACFNKRHATIEEMVNYFRAANLEAAKICNHQRTSRKPNLDGEDQLKTNIREKRKELQSAKGRCDSERILELKQELEDLEEQLEESRTKAFALNTSKEHYIDPRIIVAWSLKHNVPIDKIYNKHLQRKFKWAINLADKDFEFG